MNKPTQTLNPPLVLEAIPATMGWSIVAKYEGETFFVEGGLSTPDARLKFWQARELTIINAILKARAALALAKS